MVPPILTCRLLEDGLVSATELRPEASLSSAGRSGGNDLRAGLPTNTQNGYRRDMLDYGSKRWRSLATA